MDRKALESEHMNVVVGVLGTNEKQCEWQRQVHFMTRTYVLL